MFKMWLSNVISMQVVSVSKGRFMWIVNKYMLCLNVSLAVLIRELVKQLLETQKNVSKNFTASVVL